MPLSLLGVSAIAGHPRRKYWPAYEATGHATAHGDYEAGEAYGTTILSYDRASELTTGA